jgi:hypothetical protein
MKYLLVLLLLVSFVNGLEITEIYYDPPGNDNNLEFIEVITNLNLSNYTIADSSSNDTLIQKKFVNNSFALIVEDDFDYSKLNCSIYTIGATIGNNLNNQEDEIYIYNHNFTLLDNVSYNSEIYGNYSINKFNESWHFSKPNPCESFQPKIKNNSEQDECDFSLFIETDKFLYEDESIKFKHLINPRKPENYSIEYWIEDLYGNIIKDSYLTKNTNKKSFSPKDDGANIYKIISVLNVEDCDDINLTNNKKTFLVLHKSSKEKICPKCVSKSCPESKCSCAPCAFTKTNLETKIDILDLEINDSIKIKLLVVKDSSRKRLIEIYVKDNRNYLTEKYKLYVNQSNSVQEFNISLKLKNISLPEKATLFVEGLGKETNRTLILKENVYTKEQRISIAMNNQNTLNQQKENKITSKAISETTLDFDKEKRIQLIPTFILIASIILNIVLIFKKI